MAKVYGIQGSVIGKIANSVYYVVKGINLARAYNGSPENPQTSLQVASRARLKLMSQLAAAVAPMIMMDRQGLASPRNMFISKNYDLSSYNEQTELATIDYGNIDLSGGLVGIPALVLETRTENTVKVTLAEDTNEFDIVTFGGVLVDSLGRIRTLTPVQVTRPSDAPYGFNHTFTGLTASSTGVIYAVGLRFNDDMSKAKYGQLTAASGNANILVVRNLLRENTTKSATASVDLYAYQP